jgi:chromosome segregation ATPase
MHVGVCKQRNVIWIQKLSKLYSITFTLTCRDIQERIRASSELVESLNVSVKAAHSEQCQLESDIQQQRQFNHDKQAVVEKLNSRIGHTEREIAQRKAELADEQNKLAHLELTSRDYEDRRSGVLSELTATRQKAAELSSQHDSVSQQVYAARAELHSLQEKRIYMEKIQIESLHKQKRVIQAAVSQSENSANAQAVAGDMMNLHITSLRMDCKERLGSIEEKKCELEKIRREMKIYETQLRQKQNSLKQAQEQLAETKISAHSLEEELVVSKSDLAEESTKNDSILENVKSLRSTLIKRVADLNAFREKMRTTERKIDHTKHCIVDVDREVNSDENECRRLEIRNDEIEKQNESKTLILEDLAREYILLTSRRDTLQDESKVASEKLEDSDLSVKSITSACHSLRAKKFTKQAQLEKIEDMISEKLRQTVKIETDLSLTRTELEQTYSEINRIVNQLESMKSDLREKIARNNEYMQTQNILNSRKSILRSLELQLQFQQTQNVHPWTVLATTDPEEFHQLRRLLVIQKKLEQQQYLLVNISSEIVSKQKLLQEIQRIKLSDSWGVLKCKLSELIRNYKEQKYEIAFLEDSIRIARNQLGYNE